MSLVRVIVGVVLLAAFGGWFVRKEYLQHQREQHRDQAAAEAESAMVRNLRDVVLKFDANSRWPHTLAGTEGIRVNPILSIELQRIWMTGTPILFVGRLDDVALNEDGRFRVSARREPWLTGSPMLKENMQLTVICPAEIAEPLIAAATGARYPPFYPDVALVTNIESVSPTTQPDLEGQSERAFSVLGTCLSAHYLEQPLPADWDSR
jgi:hypothetical protein